MKNIGDYITELITREGGYANNPADKGGETMWGITVAVAKANGFVGAMQDMPRETAAAIYRAQFWTKPSFDKVWAMNPGIANELLDTGVNMGTVIAGKFLQRALNVLNKRATLFPDLAVDGSIGPGTLAGLQTYLDKRGIEGYRVLMNMLNAQQSVRYMEIAEGNASQEEFEYGWQANRVAFE